MTALAVPGPTAVLPGLGPNLALLRLARDPVHRMAALFGAYGDIVALSQPCGTRVFSTNPRCPGTVLGRGPEFLRVIETDGRVYHRTPLSGRLRPENPRNDREVALQEWATGLFAVNDEEHANIRKLIAPAFVRRQVEGWAPAVVEATRQMLDGWEVGSTVDLHDEMMGLTLRVATQAFFGTEIGREGTIAHDLEASLKRVLSPSVLLAPFDLPGLPYRRFLDHVEDFSREMHRIVRERREEGAEGADVLSTLIRASRADGVELSDTEVVGHASVVFTAGHETSSNTLVWVFFLLMQHPEVANALCEEVQSVLRGAEPTVADLKEMPLLEHVVLEALRIMPPAPWNTRITTRDTELLGYPIPKDAEVIGSIFHTHRLPDLWPDAGSYRPERWQTAKPTNYEFNPFGGGARSCPGAQFAMMELRLILAVMLSRIRPELVAGAPIDPVVNIMISLRHGMPVRVCRADGDWRRGWSRAEGDVRRYLELEG